MALKGLEIGEFKPFTSFNRWYKVVTGAPLLSFQQVLKRVGNISNGNISL
jgi:hypothetical protein